MLVRCLAAVLGGLVLSTGFAPVGFAAALPLGVAVLALSVRGTSLRRAWLPSWTFGLAFFGALLWWLRAVGVDAWVALAGVQSLYFIPLGLGLAAVARLPAWPVWSALLWVSVETWRGAWPFGGLTWGRLSFGSADTVWAAGLPWLGMTGTSLLIALTGTTAAWLVTSRLRNRIPAAAAVAALVAACGLPMALDLDIAHEERLDVAAVQADVPGDGTDVLAHHREITRAFADATVDLAESGDGVDLVVWSENSTAVDPFLDAEANSHITRASDAIGVPILVGGMVDSPREKEVLNQGIVWQPQTGGGDRYTKRHPVPYGEYIPFRGSFIPDSYGQLALIPRDMARGTSLEPLRAAGALVADAICFDVSYDDVIHGQVAGGGQLVTVQTSNAMFINTAQIDQQFEISRLRAIETGRYVVVAAINGVSGIIAPDGKVLESAPPRTRAVLQGEVALADDLTPAVAMGAWPGRVIVFMSILCLTFILVTYRRQGSPTWSGKRPTRDRTHLRGDR
ncbi:apolipoprotein N-acyltransferase [Nocardioides piscis]|uniref:Apolipoprotein N-acyltransferase n=1 Tax=Nocardioides piscis TaxID=2714938 RepID=A0A6G7YIF4_9ACTN|nr:apolipoprotein N-acyltransferase [Nocardioides piscis]QIK76496.1 apolipoprotein N-acyltransferase [Nocardioides piscis]